VIPPLLVEESQRVSRKQEAGSVVSGETGSVSDRTDVSALPFIDALPSAHPPVEAVPPVRSKQRLAGHTGKIRLQTAPMPAMTPPTMQVEVSIPPDPPMVGRMYEYGYVREPVEVRVHLTPSEIEERVATASIPRVDTRQSEVGTTSNEQHAEDAALGVVGIAGRGMLSGSGVFERGLADLMIYNSRITESSVVVIMLTSDPGPVVVQYVSLHPSVGFTIHLTAPATMKASFNYVVLLGELF
jgi:hypothetical protein